MRRHDERQHTQIHDAQVPRPVNPQFRIDRPALVARAHRARRRRVRGDREVFLEPQRDVGVRLHRGPGIHLAREEGREGLRRGDLARELDLFH